MKRFAMILVAAATLIGGTGVAMAQHHGGGGAMGGGAMGGGGMHSGGGAWHGGGSWSGGSWQGGSNWHGGSWNGNWHGGNWGWHRTTVVIGFGGPWWGWWPAYYPYWYGYSYPYYYPYYPYYPYSSDAPMYDYGSYVQKPDAGYQGDASQQAAPSQGYQYYCPNPAGYYPQVPTCAAGWLRVVPQNAPGPTSPR